MTSPLKAAGATPFTSQLPASLPLEATFQGDIARGSPTARVRLVQEWLTLHDARTKVDGDYGGATTQAVELFQQRNGLPQTGVVDRPTFDRLVAPMLAVLQTITPPPGATLGQMTVAYARQHLAQHPREVGGENMGPWVRLYMDGNQGADQLWCSGFATYVQRQAATTLGMRVPVARSVSCDDMAHGAKRAACFVAGCPDFKAITPGSLFLVRKSADDWQHIGVVTRAEKDAFHTIEGNTNDEGSREGFEVCERVRAYDGKDFIIVA